MKEGQDDDANPPQKRGTMRQPSPLFNDGLSLVKLCDLPDNGLTYVVTCESLCVAATQWGDHKFVGGRAREELIGKLIARPEITQYQDEQ
jgi:hypothetical protein